MAALVGLRGQLYTDHFFDVSGTITSGGTAQILLPVALSRSSLLIQNISDTNMFISIGAPPATAALSSGTVSTVTAGNAGAGYSRPPQVMFLGGSLSNRASAPTYSLAGLPDYPAPSNPASAHCVMTGTAPNQTISSIAVDNPGSGYAYPPFVFLVNDPLDPYGFSVPSATNGIELVSAGGSYTSNGSVCTTNQIAIFCASSSKAYTVKFSL